MSIWGTVGQTHSIAITHWKGDETLHPVAYIYNHVDVLLSTLPLVHRAKGYYSICWHPDAEGLYNVVVVTYNDEAYLIENEETQREGRSYFINSLIPTVAGLPDTIADKVWDETLPGEHDLPNSSGLYQQVIRHTVLDILGEVLSDPTHSLPVIEQKLSNARTALNNAIEINTNKLNALSTQSSEEYLDIVSEIGTNRTDLAAHDAHLSNVKLTLQAEINENGVKLNEVLSAIQQIQNNTRYIAVVPAKMRIPDVGTKVYQFFLAIYDLTGGPAAPDHAPRVRIVSSSGTELLPYTPMTLDGTKVGQYYYNHSINLTTPENVLRIEFEVVENGVTSYLPRSSEYIIYDSNLDGLENKIDLLNISVDDINDSLTGGNGLSVINAKLDSIDAEVNQNEGILTQIKSKTNLIISNPTSTLDVTTLRADIAGLPHSVELQYRLDVQTSAIKGPDNRTLTQVYDNERGTDNALLANDPRLAFLDAAISSRSSHTVSDIWAYATRTLTSYPPLSSVEVAKIWDYLTTGIVTSGSIGKYILDMMDAKVSSLSTLTMVQLLNALAPLALESTFSTLLGTIQNESNENEIKLNEVLNYLGEIKPQTDKIISGVAQQISVINEINENQSLIAGMRLIVDAIKTKTDYLHNDIAHQSTVVMIPTNPLLINDNRLTLLSNLNRLDIAVSTRATSFPSDYAKSVELSQVKGDIIAEININEAKINQLPTDTAMNTKLIKLDNILVSLDEIKGGGFATLFHSLVKIKEAIPGGGSSGGLTAQDVWNYVSRTLTSYPNTATPTDVALAKTEILAALPAYRCNMTTTFITQSDVQEVLCWLDKDGQTLPGTSQASIVVSDGATDLWSGSVSAPDARGVFRITRPNISQVINTADKNFAISITIKHMGKDYTTTQPFYTVG